MDYGPTLLKVIKGKDQNSFRHTMIDLHTHSTASDGTLSPEALVELAAKQGITAIALTDHETVTGVVSAQERGKDLGVEVVSAVEIGASLDKVGEVHLLGYFINTRDESLLDCLEWLREERRSRGRKIVERLRELGALITFEQVEKIAQGESLGRPHIAQALVDNGQATSVKKAFEIYLKSTGPANIKREQLEADEAISLIRRAGGIAVLAHPCTVGGQSDELPRVIGLLMELGLEGIEVFYSQHNAKQVSYYKKLATVSGLLMTTGSDFHGSNKPDIKMGQSIQRAPAGILQKLREAANSRSVAYSS